MDSMLCCIWWLLLGVLIGWLLHWLLSRATRLKSPDQSGLHSSGAPAHQAPSEPGHTPGATNGRATAASPPVMSQASLLSEPASAAVVFDAAAAKAAGLAVRGDDDLEIIEGIGPKIKAILNGHGIVRFADLAQTPVARLQSHLNEAGPRFKLAIPASWPEQAHLAATNQWQALKALQDTLDAGVDRSALES